MNEKPLRDLVAVLSQSPNYATITEVFSRLLAAKPHSADVEFSTFSNLMTAHQ